MWNDRLRFAERVENDWRVLTDEQRAVATRALETIDEDPIVGAPLFEPLRGYWSYRSEGIRIIYRIVTEARFIVVLNFSDFTQYVDLPFSTNGVWTDLLNGNAVNVNNFRLWNFGVNSNWGCIFFQRS